MGGTLGEEIRMKAQQLPNITLEEKLEMLNKGYYELIKKKKNGNKIQYLNKTYYEINPILGCQPDTYFISLDGEIYSRHISKTMSPVKNKDGYLYCAMATPDHQKVKVSVAKIMLMTFRGEPPTDMKHPSTEHLNGIRDDNWIMNLIWMEHSENSSCRHNKGKGENNPKVKLNENKVHEICNLLEKGNYAMQKIANMYGVGKGCINSIKRRRNWTYISDQYNF